MALKVTSALFADGGTLPNSAVFNGFGLTGYTDFGAIGYGGAAPPPGPAHHYQFNVYALDVDTLGLGSGTTGAMLMFCMNGHILDQGRLTAVFAR